MKKTILFLKFVFVISVIIISQISAQSYVKLEGTVFDNVEPSAEGREGAAAFNGVEDDPNDYVDAVASNDVYVGLDLGGLYKITKIRFFPRWFLFFRMDGGKFQGSFNGIDFTDIYTINGWPAQNEWTEVLVDADCRYVRYLSPVNSYCNVTEIEFYRTPGQEPSLSGLANSDANNAVVLYPSPVADRLSLSVNADKIIITNLDGKDILRSEGSSVDVSSLNKGVYLVKYFVGGDIGISKIVKR